MITRNLLPRLAAAAAATPAVAVTGPRQSGKTTLCRHCFPDHGYVTLEPLDVREFATSDPRGFLSQHSGPVILDEVQQAPGLLSYVHEAVDEDPAPGRFILTGSQHFVLSEAIGQSLAGRVSVLNLLPLSLDEVRRFSDSPRTLWATVWTGGYPRIHDRGLDAGQWLSDYVTTYVQRDVRQVLNVKDLGAFNTFLRLAAGRSSQVVNSSGLGADVGVSYNTIQSWISVLETSFVVHSLPPWFRNLRKRFTKSAKMHFVDSGLLCNLLGIRSPAQLEVHPLRGPIFESWVVAEVLKARLHAGSQADLYHLREDRGLEIDLLVEAGDRILATEIKSGATVSSSFFGALNALGERANAALPGLSLETRVVFGGEEEQQRGVASVVPWHLIQNVEW